MFKPALLLPLFENITTQHLWLGYSGGLDSQVLLHALVELIKQQPLNFTLTQLHAVHINHGWSPHAPAWDHICQQTCQQLGVDYRAITVNAQPSLGESPEACAREARYQALASAIKQNDILLTAHQQDDQAETLLLQLLRGSGIKGLASMPQLTAFATGWHLRPLLNFSRADLLEYANQHGLKWIEDESNTNTRYTRNYLRHTILPELKQRWPQVNATIARTAEHCAEASQLLDELAQADLIKVQSTPHSLSCSALLTLSIERQKNVLRYWLRQLNIALPSTIQLQHILQDILTSKQDACPKVAWQSNAIRRYQDNLYITHPFHSPDANTVYLWDLIKPLTIPSIGAFTASLTPKGDICADIIQKGQLSIQFRQTGERCHPAGRQGSHPLKKLFQEWKIPPWQRDRIPLLYCNNELVAVIGYCVCTGFNAHPDTSGWRIQIQ